MTTVKYVVQRRWEGDYDWSDCCTFRNRATAKDYADGQRKIQLESGIIPASWRVVKRVDIPVSFKEVEAQTND